MKFPIAASLTLAVALAGSLAAQSVERKDGFIPLLWDADQGRLSFEISRFDQDILYFTSVAKGSGSGSVGFEWAGGGEGGVIQFQHVGPKVLVVLKNTRFRAGNGGPGLEQGVDESFPDSILASLPVTKTEGGKVIVDATPLLVRDGVGFASGGRGGGRGGNLPGGVTELVAGTTLYLPIHVDGALFSVGDGHGVQGDGEVCVTAIETGLIGTFELIVRDDMHLEWPRAETPTHVMTMAFDPDLDDCVVIALRQMVDLVAKAAGIEREDTLF